MMGLDGEDMRFHNFVNFECLPHNLEVIVDYAHMMSSSKYFA